MLLVELSAKYLVYMSYPIICFKELDFLQGIVVINFKYGEFATDHEFVALIGGIVYKMIVVVLTPYQVVHKVGFLRLPRDYSPV